MVSGKVIRAIVRRAVLVGGVRRMVLGDEFREGR